MIIKRAIEKSKYIEKSDYIVKITGRYIIKNIKLILDDLEKQENFYVATMYVPNEKYTYSGLIVCKSDFILSYLIPLQNKIDDSKLQPIEVALHLAVENALQDGNRCISFVQKPQIIGYSGTWNAKIREDNYFDIELSVSSILIFLRKYRKAFIRRSKIFLNRINPYNQFKK